jgi:glyoxylase-like metal-dependent hydrolase (beta-lactamase superfamily II)
VIDPGPLLDAHVDAVADEVGARGGAAGLLLTHHHPTTPRRSTRSARASGAELRLVAHGERAGPLEAVATPGHTRDHLAYVAGSAAFTGDAVLGEGSVFIVGQLSAYLDALRALRARSLDVVFPGHGPVVEDPDARLDGYVAHRLDRERRLVAALDSGRRTVDELLDEVWDDAPAVLRPAAAATLAAHLDKLEEEDRLPPGVGRPQVRPSWAGHERRAPDRSLRAAADDLRYSPLPGRVIAAAYVLGARDPPHPARVLRRRLRRLRPLAPWVTAAPARAWPRSLSPASSSG